MGKIYNAIRGVFALIGYFVVFYHLIISDLPSLIKYLTNAVKSVIIFLTY